MTTLSETQTRCLGLLPASSSTTEACKRRSLCARYLQRTHGCTLQTPVAQWLCPGLDNYWDSYIAVQPA